MQKMTLELTIKDKSTPCPLTEVLEKRVETNPLNKRKYKLKKPYSLINKGCMKDL